MTAVSGERCDGGESDGRDGDLGEERFFESRSASISRGALGLFDSRGVEDLRGVSDRRDTPGSLGISGLGDASGS